MVDTNGAHRTELEKRARERWCVMSDGARVRVLDFEVEPERSRGSILVIPGFATVFQSWEKIVERLVGEYRVLYFESREKGSCRMPNRRVERAVTLHRMALDLRDGTRELALEDEDYLVVCSSTGGTILVEALSESWLRPSAAVLIGPAIEHRLSRWAAFGTSILPSFMQSVAIPIYRWYLGRNQVNREQHAEQYAKYVRAAEEVSLPRIRRLLWEMTRHDCWDRLPRVDTPCLVVAAADDGMHAAADSRRTHELLRGSAYVELPDNRATHSVGLVDVMEDYVRALDSDGSRSRTRSWPRHAFVAGARALSNGVSSKGTVSNGAVSNGAGSNRATVNRKESNGVTKGTANGAAVAELSAPAETSSQPCEDRARLRPAFSPLRFFTARFCNRVWLREVEGLENLPSTGPYIVAAPHASYLDFFMMAALFEVRLRVTLRFWAKTKMMRHPMFRHFCRAAGCLEVASPRNSDLWRDSLDCLRRDEKLCIFPEGTRTETGSPGRFKLGYLKLAADAGVPIVPIEILNTFEVWPRRHRLPRLGGVRLVIHEPVEVARGQSLQSLRHVNREVQAACFASQS